MSARLTEGARLIVVSGAFGTGKTEVAINLALALREEDRAPVTLVDLDIVNVYFRSRQKAYALEAQGIRVISSTEGMENADMPALSPAIAGCFDRKDGPVVFDLGGSDLGGIVAAYLHRGLSAEPVNHWLVVNPYRPFNDTPEATVEMAAKIEGRSRLAITGMIANPHLIADTTAEVIREGLARVRRITRYRLAALAVMESFYTPGAFDDEGLPVLVMRKQMKQPWEAGGIMMAGRRGTRWA
ncbi:MAG TPA: hypothetical protein VK911_02805 [Vicinamibacterales bacterium]|nr:hypothetical protein [Vicinamibacterales bacterium]